MKDYQPSDFAALVGIDWADRKHDLCERSADSSEYAYTQISSAPASILAWSNDLAVRFPNQKIAVGCELTKGPLVYALSAHKHIVLFPISPSTVAKYRDAFTHSGAKDDPSDVMTILLELELAGETIRYPGGRISLKY